MISEPDWVTFETICMSQSAAFSARFPSQWEYGIPGIHGGVGGIPPHLGSDVPGYSIPLILLHSHPFIESRGAEGRGTLAL